LLLPLQEERAITAAVQFVYRVPAITSTGWSTRCHVSPFRAHHRWWAFVRQRLREPSGRRRSGDGAFGDRSTDRETRVGL